MSTETDFVFEKFTEYYGTTKNVQKQINECKVCGSKLSFSHLSDFKNMIIQETSRCSECGHKNKKKIHIIN